MAQFDRMQKYRDSPKSPSRLIVDQIRRGREGSKWSPTSLSPSFWKDHDPEEDHSQHHKKSVLTKVKEKAKKFRHNLSKKKHSENGNSTPSWGVSLDDDEDEEDAEYHGAPMYESELAPEGYKETARQHPRAAYVVSEKHVLACSVNLGADKEKGKTTTPSKIRTETVTTPSKIRTETATTPSNIRTETVTKKLAPAYAAVTDATNAIASKIQGLTISTQAGSQAVSEEATPESLSCSWAPPQTYSTTESPQPYSAPAALQSRNASTRDQKWDKGVSVKEYLMQKIEPGEDERALSQAISEAMSPRKTPGDFGVVEKVREAVNSLLWKEESPKYTAANSATSSTSHMQVSQNAPSAKSSPIHLPISTNAHEIDEEESQGRILQAN